MNINQLNKASHLSAQYNAITVEIDYFREMQKLLVTGETKTNLLMHICDMNHKQSLIDKFEKDKALENLNGSRDFGNIGIQSFLLPPGPIPEDQMRKILGNVFGVQEKGKSSQKQKDTEEHKVGSGCMQTDIELEVKLAVTICQAIVKYKVSQRKEIVAKLNKYGVTI